MFRKLRVAALTALTGSIAVLTGADQPVASPPVAVTRAACAGVDAARITRLVQRVFDARAGETRAVLLLVNGCPAIKAYAPGYGDANRFVSWSMAKTLTAFTLGALAADGRLPLDAPAPLAEWHRPGDPRGAITLREMMQMRSGLRHVEVGAQVEDSDTNQVLFVSGTQAMAAAAARAPLASAPGTRFVYSSLTSLLLAEIFTRQLTDSRDPATRATAYTDFAQRRVYGPVGARPVLEFDGAGTQIGGSLVHMTLDDWGRVGSLLFDGRAPDGRQVIDPGWLAFIKAPSPAEPAYGGQLWTNRPSTHEHPLPDKAPVTTVAMLGHLGQRVIAAEANGRRVLLVRLGNTREDAGGPLTDRLGDVVAAALSGPR